jgi:hypothetical protein
MVVEVLGRDSGFLAVMSAIAGGADAVMVPEFETQPEDLLDLLDESYDKGKPRFTVVASEGASQSGGEFRDFVNDAGGSYQADLTVLGHIQSGGSPTSFDPDRKPISRGHLGEGLLLDHRQQFQKYSCGPRRYIRTSSRTALMCGMIEHNEGNTTEGWQIS